MTPLDWEELTLEQSSDQQIVEFDKKYHRTHVHLSVDGKPPRFVEYTEYTGKFFHFYDKERDACYTVSTKTDCKITAGFPKAGLVNYDKKCYFVHKIPARQHKLAPNSSNFGVYDLFAAIPYMGTYRELTEWYEVVRQAYQPDYVAFDDAIYLIRKGDADSVAVTSNFALSLHPTKDNALLLWMKNYAVGEVDEIKRTIKVEVPVLEQEVLDFVKRNNIMGYSLK